MPEPSVEPVPVTDSGRTPSGPGRGGPDVEPLYGWRARFEPMRLRTGMTRKAFTMALLLPAVCAVVIAATLLVAPATERGPIFGGTLVALAAGLAATSIGVFGGVLVPGLLLLSVDARFAAAMSLFLQVLVIPLAAGSHYRLGNFSKRIAIPLVIGGVTGAFVGPFFASLLPKSMIAQLVAGMIVIVGIIVLATMRMTGLGQEREDGDVPQARVGGIGLVAGFASGISGAGWGPIGVKLLILSRIPPRQAIGSSLFARVPMATAALIGYVISASAFQDVQPDWWLVLPLFAGSVAMMLPGAILLSKLGRDRATIGITLLSIALALPSLIWPH